MPSAATSWARETPYLYGATNYDSSWISRWPSRVVTDTDADLLSEEWWLPPKQKHDNVKASAASGWHLFSTAQESDKWLLHQELRPKILGIHGSTLGGFYHSSRFALDPLSGFQLRVPTTLRAVLFARLHQTANFKVQPEFRKLELTRRQLQG